MRIGILLFEGVDLLDSGGPYEVFLTASRLTQRDGAPAPFEIVTLTTDGAPVTAYGGLILTPGSSLAAVGAIDLLLVPGTTDLSSPLADTELIEAVRTLSADAELTASVCTGAFLLAKAGLLGEKKWTTHWEDIDLLAETVGAQGAVRHRRWVDAGEIVTSGGLSSGIAMALHLVARFAGRELADRTARQIEYDWNPTGDA